MNTGPKQKWPSYTQSSTYAQGLSTHSYRSRSLLRHPSAAQGHLHVIQPQLGLPRIRTQ